MTSVTNLALVYLKQKNYQECIDVCDRALKADPLCHKAIFLKGRALCETQKYRNANALFQNLIDTATNEIEKQQEAEKAKAELEKDK